MASYSVCFGICITTSAVISDATILTKRFRLDSILVGDIMSAEEY